MRFAFEPSALRRTGWQEYTSRFVFGGIVTVVAGLIADRFGAGIGGLFLAFPAIFPASASLIQKHEKERKERAGESGTRRGRAAAGVDAAGAAIGSTGLAVFAAIVWTLLPRFPLARTLAIGIVCWGATAVLAWIVHRKTSRFLRRRFAAKHPPPVTADSESIRRNG
ncbi:MAG TPA: DUF3147 family protein [Verrucomicrobiae bacterium]|nr:DUF3147 family protein [Verrucomicrobiae bacterium]